MIIIFQDVRAPEVITIPLTTPMEHLLTQYGNTTRNTCIAESREARRM